MLNVAVVLVSEGSACVPPLTISKWNRVQENQKGK